MTQSMEDKRKQLFAQMENASSDEQRAIILRSAQSAFSQACENTPLRVKEPSVERVAEDARLERERQSKNVWIRTPNKVVTAKERAIKERAKRTAGRNVRAFPLRIVDKNFDTVLDRYELLWHELSVAANQHNLMDVMLDGLNRGTHILFVDDQKQVVCEHVDGHLFIVGMIAKDGKSVDHSRLIQDREFMQYAGTKLGVVGIKFKTQRKGWLKIAPRFGFHTTDGVTYTYSFIAGKH